MASTALYSGGVFQQKPCEKLQYAALTLRLPHGIGALGFSFLRPRKIRSTYGRDVKCTQRKRTRSVVFPCEVSASLALSNSLSSTGVPLLPQTGASCEEPPATGTALTDEASLPKPFGRSLFPPPVLILRLKAPLR